MAILTRQAVTTRAVIAAHVERLGVRLRAVREVDEVNDFKIVVVTAGHVNHLLPSLVRAAWPYLARGVAEVSAGWSPCWCDSCEPCPPWQPA